METLFAAVVARARAFAFPRADVRDVAIDAAGTLWVATDAGLVVGDGRGAWYTLDALDGLPFADVRGVRVGPDASLWVWFARGLACLSKGQLICQSGVLEYNDGHD